jgi:hypothetical protein
MLLHLLVGYGRGSCHRGAWCHMFGNGWSLKLWCPASTSGNLHYANLECRRRQCSRAKANDYVPLTPSSFLITSPCQEVTEWEAFMLQSSDTDTCVALWFLWNTRYSNSNNSQKACTLYALDEMKQGFLPWPLSSHGPNNWQTVGKSISAGL